MKSTVVLLAVFASIAAWAQTPPPGTISHPPGQPMGTTNQAESSAGVTNQAAAAGTTTNQLANLSFTNSAGQVYSVDQLAGQLQTLRRDIDQTLPTLTAFSETYSNVVTSGGQTSLGEAVSGIITSVLNRNTNAAATAGPTSLQATNLLSALQQALTTNAPASTQANPTRFEDLLALQERLLNLPPLLQKLNVASTTNQYTAPSPLPGGLSPTGR